MASPLTLVAVVLWAGAALLLAEIAWFRRCRLISRLEPYTARGMACARSQPGTARPQRMLLGLLGPAACRAGALVARAIGAGDQTAARLRRIHSFLDLNAFRMRQMGAGLLALAAAGTATALLGLSASLGLLLLLAAPLGAVVGLEARLAQASARWQQRVCLQLPVVAEQVAMLLSAGFSIGTALARVAHRGRGEVARDLSFVCERIRQGLSEADACCEWAERADVRALDRLVSVVALGREGGDLARMLSAEARAVRADLQRGLVATAERRSQQVWIPVTVAALVPGVAFLAVPFLEALRLFSSP